MAVPDFIARHSPKLAEMQRLEDEANAFAMALLMPEKFVREAVAKAGGVDLSDDKAIEKLAREFQVPNAVMAYRLGQLF